MSQAGTFGGGLIKAIPVTVPEGGTGVVSITDHALIVGSGVGAITVLAAATDGQICIGSTGADPTIGNITSSGATVTITNGAGTINLETAAAVAIQFDGDGGSAVPALGVLTLAGGTNLTSAAAGSTVTFNLDAAISGTTSHDFAAGGRIGTALLAGNTTLIQAYDVDGAAYVTFATLTANNTPTMDLDDAVTKASGYIYRAGGTDVPVTDGGTGVSTLTDHGIILGSGAGAVTVLAAATDGQIPVGTTGADPVLANITSARDLLVTNGAGTLDITLTDNAHRTSIHGWNGAIIESPAVTVTAAGGVITFSIEKSGGGNLTAIFSDGFYAWTTAPDTIVLTAGSDTSPQANYVYFLQSTKLLTVSTSAFPSAEHCPLATVLCQSAASLQTEGAYKVHAWTDHITDSAEQGHVAHLNAWIRNQNATYTSGVAQTLTITPNGGTPDNVIFTSASGVVYQLHNHVFPAFAGTPDVYTVNDSGTAYNIVTDLNALLTDSTGASMSGRYFSLVIWGVVSEATGDCKLMVNLPGGSYGVAAQLAPDAERYADYSIPTDFKGTGFLISQLNLRHQVSASGTWTSIDEIDLRGFFPNLSAGSSTSFATEFEDNTFRIIDDSDNTKELAFQVSGVTTATTRTITMDDRDIDLDAVPDSFATDGAAATPAAGIVTFTGGNNIATSGAGSTVTIDLNGATQYALQVGDATGSLDSLGIGTATQILQSGGAGAIPAWSTATYPATTAQGDLLYSSSANTLAALTKDATATRYLANTGVTNNPAWDQIELTNGVSGILPVTNGGTGIADPTDHSLLVGSGAAALTEITVGTDGQVLLGSTGADPVFATLTSSGSTIAFTPGAGTLNLETGTAVAISAPTDSGTATPSAGALTIAGGDNIDTSGAGSTVTIAVSSAVCDSVATDSGTATPSAGILTIAGGGDVTTSGSGSTVTVTATGGGGGITWSIITADLNPMIVDTGYICNKAGLLTVTLPTTAAVGTVQRVTGINTDLGWKIAQSAGQQIHFGSVSTSSGAGGSLASVLKRDSVELVCVVADTEWNVVSSSGNITIV